MDDTVEVVIPGMNIYLATKSFHQEDLVSYYMNVDMAEIELRVLSQIQIFTNKSYVTDRVNYYVNDNNPNAYFNFTSQIKKDKPNDWDPEEE